MNLVAIGFCFLVAFLLTLSRGAGAGLVYGYLPALLLLVAVTGFQVLGLPDPTPPTAAIYGILAGSVLRGRLARLRLVSVDYLFLLVPLVYAVSAIRTEYLYTGVSIFGSVVLQLVAPYFIARASLESRSTQREAIFVLAACSLVIAFFGLIEFRLVPNTYAHLMTLGGLRDSYVDFAFQRFGFFRATSSFFHPIDLGNSAALIFTTLAIFGLRSEGHFDRLWVRVGLAAALVSWFVAGSFTSYLGLGSGLALYLMLERLPVTRRFLVPGMLAAVAIGILYAATLATTPVGESSAPSGSFAGSLWIRHVIIQKAWAMATSAGPFGWGRLVPIGDLKSLDNAYLVIAIQRGWVALALWLALPVLLARLVSRALRRASSERAVRRILLAFCGTFGTMVAMFTVWFGFAYQSLFAIVVALAVNASLAALRTVRARPQTIPSQTPRLVRHA